MISLVRAAGWALGALWISSGAFAESAHQNQPLGAQQIPRIEGSGIRVDGRLDEPFWSKALEIPLDFESRPGDGIGPPVRTIALLAHDDHQLYIAFRAFDTEPPKIRAHLMDRDRQETFEQDDYVALILDTYNDSRRAFEFRVNPLGVQMDGLYNQLDERDFSWDAIWDSAGLITEEGYQVEMAIPFDQLRFLSSNDEQTWGIGFSRSWPRDVRHQIGAHKVDRNNTCELCQFFRFRGFAGLASGRNLELTPTLTYDHTDRAPSPGESLSSKDDQVEAGASLRWGITRSMTLSATYNPDFSQVESDELQLSANQRFALFYPEKRNFFLEGSDFFSTQVQTVFTRTVADPRWGLKLTGKPANRSALGLFVAEDEVNNVLLPSNEGSSPESLPGKVRSVVGRFRQDVGRSSYLGAVYTRREGEQGYSNEVAGVDAYFRLADRHVVQLQALRTETTYPAEIAAAFGQQGEEPLDGQALEALYSYQSRDWLASLGWRSYDEGLRVDTGFVPRVDFKTWRSELARTFWSDHPSDFFNKIRLSLLWLKTENQRGELTDDKFDFLASFEMPRQSQFAFESIYRDERSGATLFENLLSNRISFEIQPSEAMRLEAEVTIGDAIDNANQRLAQEWILWLKAEVKPGIHWNTQLALAEQSLEVGAKPFLDQRIADVQVTYQFDMRSFLRVILQYSERDYDAANDPSRQRDEEKLASQLLFSYKINPQTLLFVGYSDAYLGLDQQGLDADGRTLFFKMSYAFRR